MFVAVFYLVQLTVQHDHLSYNSAQRMIYTFNGTPSSAHVRRIIRKVYMSIYGLVRALCMAAP
jgi:hypothetical protein